LPEVHSSKELRTNLEPPPSTTTRHTETSHGKHLPSLRTCTRTKLAAITMIFVALILSLLPIARAMPTSPGHHNIHFIPGAQLTAHAHNRNQPKHNFPPQPLTHNVPNAPSRHGRRLKYQRNTTLSILSTNIQGLTEKKMTAIDSYVRNTQHHTAFDIVLLFETKSSPAKGYHYTHRNGWTFHPIHKNPDQPAREAGGLALLIRNTSGIQVQTPDHLPPEIHTRPELGIATWLLTHDTWDHAVYITACYWPTGRVPAQQIGTVNDHIQTLHTLLYQQSKTQNAQRPHHLVLGDFNLHLLTQEPGIPCPAHEQNSAANNTSNNLLAQAINENKYRILSPAPSELHKPPYTWYKSDKHDCQKSTVDYVFGNKHSFASLKECSILENSRQHLNTDHEALATTISIPICAKTTTIQRMGTRKYQVDRLTDISASDTLKQQASTLAPSLAQEIHNITRTSPPNQTTADTLFNTFLGYCDQAAKHIRNPQLSDMPHPGHLRKRKQLPTHQIKTQIRNARTKLLRNREAERHTPDTTAEAQQIRLLQKQIHKQTTHEQRHKITKDLDDLLQYSSNTKTSVWKYIQQKQYCKNKHVTHSLPPYMRNAQGIILQSQLESARIWHTCRKQISNTHNTPCLSSAARLQNLHTRLQHLQQQQDTANIEDADINKPFTHTELHTLLRTLPNKKAPGYDGMPFDIIKSIRNQYGDTLLNIYNYIWKHEITPPQWDTAVIHMLYKKHDPLIPDNYRAIVLINTLKKIYEGLITNRLIHYVQSTDCLHHNQFGFLPNRNTNEAIFFLTETIRMNFAKHNRPTHVAFIDFKTAFPNTCRPALWAKLHQLGVQGKIWRNLQTIYHTTKGRVLHPLIKETDTYNINIGLLEGSRLSPLLYAFLADDLLKRLQSKFPHLQLESTTARAWHAAIMYADDLALVATSQEQLQALLNETQLWAEEHFAVINTDKSHTMVFMEDKVHRSARQTKTHHHYISHESNIPAPISHLKEVDTFKYLGITLDCRLSFDTATKHNTRAMWHAHSQTRLLDMHVHGLHPRHQITLWKQLIWSTMDTYLPFVHDHNHIKHFDEQIDLSLASIFCPKTWNTDCLHKALRSELGIPSANTYSTLAALRLYAHITQQAPNMPARQLLQIYHEFRATRPSAIPTQSLLTRVHTSLTHLDQIHNWTNTSLNLTEQEAQNELMRPATRRRRWLFHIAGKIAHHEHETLIQWAQKGGRPQQYIRATLQDLDNRLRKQSVSKNPFKPLPYLHVLKNSQLVSNLLRIRSQNSTIPANLPSTYKPSYMDGPKYQRIPFNERFCPSCVPPRSTWGLASPAIGTSIGTEEHLILHCASRDDTRIQLFVQINENVTALVVPSSTLPEPWYDLTDTQKLQTLLACTPPATWDLSKEETQTWYTSLEPILHIEIKALLDLGTAYRKDLDAYYARYSA
jgi:hypothetical protein